MLKDYLEKKSQIIECLGFRANSHFSTFANGHDKTHVAMSVYTMSLYIKWMNYVCIILTNVDTNSGRRTCSWRAMVKISTSLSTVICSKAL